MDVQTLDARLYRWISIANERAERYDFPPGLVEDHIQALKSRLSAEYLGRIFADTRPLHLLGLRGQVLDRWLRGGANVDDHVIQVMDLAAMLEEFKADPCLNDKVERMKRAAFWPTQFELAMALRARRTIADLGRVRLSRETNTAVGDFLIDLADGSIACECARLEFGEGEEEQYRVLGDLYQYLDHKLKKTTRPCCVKIRIRDSLNPVSLSNVVQCLKKMLAPFASSGEDHEAQAAVAEVTIGALGESSERIPFRYIDGRVHDIRDSEWGSAQSLCRVNAASDDEAAAMYRAGADFAQEEYARIFIAWQRNGADLDPYSRIQNKIRKKKNQTKATEGVLGRVIFLESQWSIEALDKDRLKQVFDREIDISRNTIAIVLAERCANVHYRPWYRYYASNLGSAYVSDNGLWNFFRRFYTYDRDFDPILNRRYRRTWEEAATLVKQDKIEFEERNRRRESDL